MNSEARNHIAFLLHKAIKLLEAEKQFIALCHAQLTLDLLVDEGRELNGGWDVITLHPSAESQQKRCGSRSE